MEVTVLAVAGSGEGGELEYMETMARRTCIFDADHTMCNLDNVVPFADLSRPDSVYLTKSVVGGDRGGHHRTCFKVVVIIKPLN